MFLQRLKAAGIALVATLVAYQTYLFALAPLVDPPAPELAASSALPDWSNSSSAVDRYRQLFANYLPAGHWALAGTPKVIENGPLMLVLDDYQTDDQGGLNLTQCVVIGFPTPRTPGMAPPSDAIILEAPGGAQLQFDAAFNPALGSVGKLLHGFFPGEIVVRSAMRSAGPEDDLHIVVNNLRYRDTLFYSEEQVAFRYGPHRGQGKRLAVRMLRDEFVQPGDNDLPLSGISLLEVTEQAQVDLELPSNTAGLASNSKQRLKVRSAGPFRFDFTTFTASFQQEVNAVMPRAEGPDDQLWADELLLRLAQEGEGPTTLTPADEPELAKQQGRLLSGIKPHSIVATGNPVRFDSQATSSTLRGNVVKAWVAERRVRIEGAPATLAHGLNELRAASIDYTSPPASAPSAVGDLTMVGPGWLRITPKEDQPERAIEARWNGLPNNAPTVLLRRDSEGQPVLTVEGRPEVASTELGRLLANQLRIQMREVPPDGPDGPAIELGQMNGQERDGQAKQRLALLPERVDATGAIDFRGKNLVGRTNRLVAWLRPRNDLLPSLANNSIQSGPALGPAAPGTTPSATPTAGPTTPQKQYALTSEQVQLDIGLVGRRAIATGLLCSGRVRFEETPPAGAEPELRVEGEQLRADGLHQDGIRLTVVGQPEGETSHTGDRQGLARISGRGVHLWAKELHADQLATRVWAEGPGDARMELGRESANGPTVASRFATQQFGSMQGEATLRWNNGFDFDGSRIEFRGDVFAESADGWLRCDRLAAKLNQPVDFRESNRASQEKIEIAEIDCLGGVSIDHRRSDATGQQLHARVRMETLHFDQTTGALSGQGPGWVRSVHLADNDWSSLTSGGSQNSSSATNSTTSTSSDAGLHFLRVNFQRGITGNLNARALRFHQRVRAIYGPVLAWDQELLLDTPNGPPEGAAVLECDELRVHEDPSARFAASRSQSVANTQMGPVEVRALGNVRLEGSSGEEKLTQFTAEASSASYTQSKEICVLEGNGQRSVSIWVKQDPRRPPARSVAGRIIYDLRRGQVSKVEDIRSVDFRTAQPPGNRSGQPAGRR